MQKNILITGCSSGLGLGLTNYYLSKNFKVITLDLPGLGNSSATKTYDTKNIKYINKKFGSDSISKLNLMSALKKDIDSYLI
jgi:NAD(P)-dependent dehydrogenase (short-subunit alcohol dehydrogenase family)